jgi:hypothetical protein
MAMRRIRAITDEAAKHSLTRSAVSAEPLRGRVRQGGTTMELIQLTPHSEVDPSQPLRAPGDILLHAYLIPNALNPAQLARRTGIPSNQIKAFIADTHPITPRSPSAFPSPSTPPPFTGWHFRRGTIWKGRSL